LQERSKAGSSKNDEDEEWTKSEHKYGDGENFESE